MATTTREFRRHTRWFARNFLIIRASRLTTKNLHAVMTVRFQTRAGSLISCSETCKND